MKKLSSKSKIKIRRVFTPPTSKTGWDHSLTKTLTLRQLIHHKANRVILEKSSFAVTVDGNLVCLANIKRVGFDLCG